MAILTAWQMMLLLLSRWWAQGGVVFLPREQIDCIRVYNRLFGGKLRNNSRNSRDACVMQLTRNREGSLRSVTEARQSQLRMPRDFRFRRMNKSECLAWSTSYTNYILQSNLGISLHAPQVIGPLACQILHVDLAASPLLSLTRQLRLLCPAWLPRAMASSN